jgi:RNA polymerase sigma-70 factor (ECF subfamily)
MRNAIEWIASEILPHEPAVRQWLRRLPHWRSDEDDLIQEAYCRLAQVADPAIIASGRAYFFTVVKNLMLERIRRDRVVRIETVAEIDGSIIVDDAVPADRSVGAREQLRLVQRLIDNLPSRCRSVFRLRRIEGLSQRQTAEQLGVSENVVEKEVAKGLRLIMTEMAELEQRHEQKLTAQDGETRVRRRD